MSDKIENKDNLKPLDLIVKSNRLVEAGYKLTSVEYNLLEMVFTQMTDGKVGQEGFWLENEFVVTAIEYSKMYEIDVSTAYEALQEASKRLLERHFKYEATSQYMPNFIEVIESNWVSKIRYSRQGGYVTVELTNDVMDLVGMLKRKFTSYFLQYTAGLTSIYAKRLYEFMVQYRKMGCKTPQMEVKELRYRLNVDDDKYPLIADFKKRVLDGAIEQINEHTDIIASYEQIKQGRTIVAFIFRFKPNKENIAKFNKKFKKLKDKENSDIVLPPPPETPSDVGLTDIQKQALEEIDKYITNNNITAPAKIKNLRKMALDGRWELKLAPKAKKGPKVVPNNKPLKSMPELPAKAKTDLTLIEKLKQELAESKT